jgi:inosose dehydratase
MNPTRRQALAAVAATAFAGFARAANPASKIITNVYPWTTFAKRENKDFYKDLDAGLGAVKEAGLDGFEPVLTSLDQVKQIAPLMKKHNLEMPSFYVNSKLHDKADADASVKTALEISAAARELGAKIVVTNPAPIKWNGPENKTDEQIKYQAEKLNELGAGLRKNDQVLAYHNHDSELRNAAREFHHMLAGTDPVNVKFCLDSHWVFRGSGDSSIALFDVISLYGDRIVELHLRQSKGGIWTEDFGTGDIDYPKLWKVLQAKKLSPLIVLEQAVEAKSPNTMSVVEAHKKSVTYAKGLFA